MSDFGRHGWIIFGASFWYLRGILRCILGAHCPLTCLGAVHAYFGVFFHALPVRETWRGTEETQWLFMYVLKSS